MTSKRTAKILQTIEKYRVPVVTALDKSGKAIDLATKLGVMYYGYRSANHIWGALIGLLGLELAKAQNMIGGAAGVGILATLGLTEMVRHSDLEVEDVKPPVWWLHSPPLPEPSPYRWDLERNYIRGFKPTPWDKAVSQLP